MTEDVAVGAADAEVPGLPSQAGVDAVPDRYANHYSGGKRPQHRKLVVIENSPLSVVTCYRMVGQCSLKPSQKALMEALATVADAKTLRWPREHCGMGGSAVEDLADMVGVGPRQTRRLLRQVEDLGLLVTLDRRPFRSEYQIMPAALEKMYEAARARHKAKRNRRRIESVAAAATAGLIIEGVAADEPDTVSDELRDSGAPLPAEIDSATSGGHSPEVDALLEVEELDCGQPVGAPDGLATGELATTEPHEGAAESRNATPTSSTATEPASAVDRAPEVDVPREAGVPDSEAALPRWAVITARNHRLHAAKVAGLVRAAWRAAGATGSWTKEGAEARNVVRAWRNLNEPSLREWTALLDGLATAASAGRIQLQKGWKLGIPELLKLTRNKNARRVAHAMPASAAPRKQGRVAANCPPVPSTGNRLLPGPAHPRDLPTGDPAEWQKTMRLLRNHLGAMFDIWIAPCELDGVDDQGRVVVKVPNQVYADWIADHYAEVFVLTAQAAVLLTWGA